ncbi:hypothetical protein IW262DRAFT_1302043 [Armillaria fumosa]|nr:hypothetical protein IW262DRAFT_1302043 [Armillaria fumosa]
MPMRRGIVLFKQSDDMIHAVHDIKLSKKQNWFEIIHDTKHPQRPLKDEWEDWMWEPCLHGVVHLSITLNSEPLHPKTDIVQGLAFEYVHGMNMEDLKPGVDISQQEAEAISSRVMDVFCTIEAENYDIQNGLHIGNIILQDSSHHRLQMRHHQKAWILLKGAPICEI